MPNWHINGLGFYIAAALALPAAPSTAFAVETPGWTTGTDVAKNPAAKEAAPKSNTTVIHRSNEAAAPPAFNVRLVALLTEDGQKIDQGLVWRVFQAPAANSGARAKLVAENREASPALKLAPGDYTVNAAFGRANLTRKLTIKSDAAPATETFVLNAGGLRIAALANNKPAPADLVSYSVFSDDREQFAANTAVITGAKPGLIIRLNSGFYRIVSTYGDANAKVEAGVTVEAGKLTEASIAHEAGKATFKLVTRPGGEALPDTHWTILNQQGELVRETVGALCTHLLAPGTYSAAARSAGRLYKSTFTIKPGETSTVEVAAGAQSSVPGGEPLPAPPIEPSFEIKTP